MRITLTNDYHGTECHLNAEVLSHIHHTSTAYLTPGQVRKAKRELCGIDGCTCSGDAGIRGPQRLHDKRLEVNCDSIFCSSAYKSL